MKRLHDLFERYFEESKNLKNATKSLSDELALQMQEDLLTFYNQEKELLFKELEREYKRKAYAEDYKNSLVIPEDVKKRWYKRIFRKIKTEPNAAAAAIRAAIDEEIEIFYDENSADDEEPEQSPVEEPANDKESEQQPERNDYPRLVEVQTDIGAQIQIQFPQENKNAD